jgi:hypothetical protein
MFLFVVVAHTVFVLTEVVLSLFFLFENVLCIDRAQVKVSGVLTRRLIIVAFEKEHDRMKIEMDRKKAMRALSSHDSRTAQSSSSSSPQRNGAKNVKRGRSRHVVQRELVNILEDTETLTDTLVSQLKELRAFGWNVGYL